MRDRLRQSYQLQREMTRSGYYEGIVEVRSLPRLTELLASHETNIRMRFEISRSAFDVPQVKGQFETDLMLECQRCLNGIEVHVQQEFELLVDAPDELLRKTSLDTVYSKDGNLDIFELLEDELILGLPLVPMHEDDACNPHWSKAEFMLQKSEKENPFLVLKKLKTSN